VTFRVRGRAPANQGIESSRQKFNHETGAGKRNLVAPILLRDEMPQALKMVGEHPSFTF
jgi:hypothetical protein